MSEYLKVPAGEPVPLSVLALDLAEPPAAGGWAGWLADRGIAMAFDDIGRRCISRADAKKLLDAQRQDEIRRQDLAVRLEREAVAADELRRSQTFRGIRADQVPDGMSATEFMLASDPDLRPRRKSATAAFLDHEDMILHPIREPFEDAS